MKDNIKMINNVNRHNKLIQRMRQDGRSIWIDPSVDPNLNVDRSEIDIEKIVKSKQTKSAKIRALVQLDIDNNVIKEVLNIKHTSQIYSALKILKHDNKNDNRSTI